jgi:hypothetical protein
MVALEPDLCGQGDIKMRVKISQRQVSSSRQLGAGHQS